MNRKEFWLFARAEAARWVAIAMALFHLYTALFGNYDALIQRGVHLGFAIALILLLHPTARRLPGRLGAVAASAFTAVLAVASFAPLAYLLDHYTYLTGERFQFVTDVTPVELVMGTAFMLALLELCRRVAGIALAAITLAFLVYLFVPGLPGIFGHAGFDLATQVDEQYLGLGGIFGVPLGASASYIAPFVIFGAFLERSGLGGFIMDFATGLVGRFRGGPAKVAVIASAFHGTISGSAPANVLTVGPVTIPMMKRLGFPAHMAGAIEAAASTGGVIMPPVMGSVAFIMASFIGVSYSVVALYAVIPALLYFFGVFCAVHWTAVRYGIRGLDPSEMPDWRRSFRERGHLLAPVAVLVTLMSLDFSPQYGAAYAILSVVAVSWLRRGTRMGPRAILEALEAGAKGAVLVAIATAAAGMIVGAFELSSVGLKLAQSASALAGTLMTGLLLTMVVSLLLGAGVPPSVAYIVQVAVTIPMLQTFLKSDGGVDPATAVVLSHFFVMYFSSLAVLTPPDALASVAAAGLAGSPFVKTGLAATRVAFVAFIVPFMFVYRPALLTLGSPAEIAEAFVFSALGVYIAAIAFEGVFRRPLAWWERGIAFAAAAALIFPGWESDLAGVVLFAFFLALQYSRRPALTTESRTQ
ncbi:MAG: TRAP transporter permease [Gemmatimonas sp.]